MPLMHLPITTATCSIMTKIFVMKNLGLSTLPTYILTRRIFLQIRTKPIRIPDPYTDDLTE